MMTSRRIRRQQQQRRNKNNGGRSSSNNNNNNNILKLVAPLLILCLLLSTCFYQIQNSRSAVSYWSLSAYIINSNNSNIVLASSSSSSSSSSSVMATINQTNALPNNNRTIQSKSSSSLLYQMDWATPHLQTLFPRFNIHNINHHPTYIHDDDSVLLSSTKNRHSNNQNNLDSKSTSLSSSSACIVTKNNKDDNDHYNDDKEEEDMELCFLLEFAERELRSFSSSNFYYMMYPQQWLFSDRRYDILALYNNPLDSNPLVLPNRHRPDVTYENDIYYALWNHSAYSRSASSSSLWNLTIKDNAENKGREVMSDDHDLNTNRSKQSQHHAASSLLSSSSLLMPSSLTLSSTNHHQPRLIILPIPFGSIFFDEPRRFQMAKLFVEIRTHVVELLEQLTTTTMTSTMLQQDQEQAAAAAAAANATGQQQQGRNTSLDDARIIVSPPPPSLPPPRVVVVSMTGPIFNVHHRRKFGRALFQLIESLSHHHVTVARSDDYLACHYAYLHNVTPPPRYNKNNNNNNNNNNADDNDVDDDDDMFHGYQEQFATVWPMTEFQFSIGLGSHTKHLPLIRPTWDKFQKSSFFLFYHTTTGTSLCNSTAYRHAPVTLVSQQQQNESLSSSSSSSFLLFRNYSSIGWNIPPEQWKRDFTKSKFCLVIRGDTPHSHALFNAIKVGCIPVVISDWYPFFAPPFPSTLDMRDFCIFLPELDFLHDPEPTLLRLQMIPDRVIRSKLKALEWAQRVVLLEHPQSLFVPAFVREAMASFTRPASKLL